MIHKSNALKAAGDAAYAEDKYGLAIGYLKAARTTVLKQDKIKDKNSPLALYAEDIDTARSIVVHKAELYVQENDNIYGKTEVEESDVEIPEGTLMVKPTEFALPKPSFKML